MHASKAEFSVAKHGYVVSAAAGSASAAALPRQRPPVVTQDTGFSAVIPVGDGLACLAHGRGSRRGDRRGRGALRAPLQGGEAARRGAFRCAPSAGKASSIPFGRTGARFPRVRHDRSRRCRPPRRGLLSANSGASRSVGPGNQPVRASQYDAQLALIDAGARRYGRGAGDRLRGGAFTRRLAERCDSVVALDIRGARHRRSHAFRTRTTNIDYRSATSCSGMPNWNGQWDLVVLAETVCYLGWLYPFLRCRLAGTPAPRRDPTWRTAAAREYLRRSRRLPAAPLDHPHLPRPVPQRRLRVRHDTVVPRSQNGVEIEALITLAERRPDGVSLQPPLRRPGRAPTGPAAPRPPARARGPRARSAV